MYLNVVTLQGIARDPANSCILVTSDHGESNEEIKEKIGASNYACRPREGPHGTTRDQKTLWQRSVKYKSWGVIKAS